MSLQKIRALCCGEEAVTLSECISFALNKYERFIKFGLVGVCNFAVDFVGYWAMSHVLSIYLSRTLSLSLACLFSYAVNKRWTFQAKDAGLMPLIRFAVVNFSTLGLGLLLLKLFTELGVHHIIAFLLIMPFTIVSNYLGYRFWSFKEIE